MTTTVYNLTLTSDQQAALSSIYTFLVDPTEQVFVLRGYSGCGKSTLVHTFLDQLPNWQKTTKLINPTGHDWDVILTATTNKAAENLARITGEGVTTIFSRLGLRVETDFKTGETKVVPRGNYTPIEGALILVDEMSFGNSELLGFMFTRTRNCKFIWIGDPAQLTPVGTVGVPPAFAAKFAGAALTTVVRQANGNPITDLSTQFRHTVNTGEWPKPVIDGHHIQHLSRADFNAAIEAEFTRTDWRYHDSKILAWTNKCVIHYNAMVRNLAKGDPDFQVGDYAVCNSFVTSGKKSLKTDQLVEITAIEPESEHLGATGNWVTVDHSIRLFHPINLEQRNLAHKRAKAANNYGHMREIDQEWIDLRGAYAQTVNKAQGSTYDKVFIDLDDIGRCNNGDQLARMLYVAVSRARDRVVLTGDLA